MRPLIPSDDTETTTEPPMWKTREVSALLFVLAAALIGYGCIRSNQEPKFDTTDECYAYFLPKFDTPIETVEAYCTNPENFNRR